MTAKTVAVLESHDWSGNVRELANVLEHAVILSDGNQITPEDLPQSLTRSATVGTSSAPTATSLVTGQPQTLREMEDQMILHVLSKHDGDKPATASELGIALKTLYNRLGQMELKRAAG